MKFDIDNMETEHFAGVEILKTVFKITQTIADVKKKSVDFNVLILLAQHSRSIDKCKTGQFIPETINH